MNISYIDLSLIALGFLVVALGFASSHRVSTKEKKVRKEPYVWLACATLVCALGFPMESQAAQQWTLEDVMGTYKCYQIGGEGTKPDAVIIIAGKKRTALMLPHTSITRIQTAFTKELPTTILFRYKDSRLSAVFDVYTRILSVANKTKITNYYCND